MTARTAPVKPARTPGRIELAIRHRARQALRAVWPYAAALGLSVAAAPYLHWAWLPAFALGAAAMDIARRAHERYGWRRAGGKAAVRRRRKFQGWAPRREVRATASPPAAARHTRRLGLHPDASPPLILATAGKAGTIAVHREKSVLFTGPPGTGKSGALAGHAADAPGALFCTSTKPELLLHTLPYRDGRVWVLNTDGYGSIPSTLAWSPLEGCEHPETAMRRAGDLVAASPRDASGKDAWHEDRAAKLIRYMLHAAAVTPGATMREAAAWIHEPWSPGPMEILASRGYPGWAGQLAALLASDKDGVISGSAGAAIGWMDDPAMADAACPPPGTGFSASAFARSTDSVYLIGRNRPYGSFAPYFAALGAEVFEQLRRHAMEQPGGRLPVPATFVLDEMPLTCPMRVQDMLADSRGYLITLLMAAQSWSQLRAMAGRDDGGTIRSATPVEVILGGEKRSEDLEDVSKVIGDRDTWDRDKKLPRQERLMPPEAIRNLPPGQAVILIPACRPVRGTLPAIWDRPGHQPATPDQVPAPPQPLAGPLAIEPRRVFVTAATGPAAVTEAPTAEEESWPADAASLS